MESVRIFTAGVLTSILISDLLNLLYGFNETKKIAAEVKEPVMNTESLMKLANSFDPRLKESALRVIIDNALTGLLLI